MRSIVTKRVWGALSVAMAAPAVLIARRCVAILTANADRTAIKLAAKLPQPLQKRKIGHRSQVGIGGRVASPPLPHHRTSGSASGGSMSWSPAALHRGRRFKERTADGGFAARRVPLQASPAPNSLKLNPKADWLAHSHA